VLYEIMHSEFYASDAAIVRALRNLTSDYVIAHPHVDFDGLSLELLCQIQFGSVSNFCDHVLKPMGEEIQNPGIVAACNALNIDINVVILDRKQPKFSSERYHPLVGPQKPEHGRPCINLMLKWGHYDLLYAGCMPLLSILGEVG